MPDYKDPRKEDIVYGDRRISRPDLSLPDWEIPDGKYRPVPIVWFTGALFVQIFFTSFASLALSSMSGWFVIILAAAASVTIGVWTWRRGMNVAGSGWKIATVIMLAVFFALTCLGAITRI